MEEYNENDFHVELITEMVHMADDVRSIKRWVTFFGILILLALILGLLFYLFVFLQYINLFQGFDLNMGPLK